MGCILGILRSIATFILIIVVFAGLILLVVVGSFTDKLLDPGFYTGAITEQDTYNRVYSEILVDPAMDETTRALLGDIDVEAEDIVPVLKEILPPEYIQAQVEDSIGRAVGYFNGDLEELDVYLDMGPALADAKAVLLEYVDQQIDQLPVEEATEQTCTPEGLLEKAQEFQGSFADLASGATPDSLPPLPYFDEQCLEDLFERVDELAIEGGGLNQEAQQAGTAIRTELEQHLMEGDSKELLKRVSHAVASPLVDGAIDRLSEGLDKDGRYDLIKALDTWDDERTEAEIRQDFADAKDGISKFNSWVKTLSYLMFFGGLGVVGLIYFPSLGKMTRWPGIALIISGGVVFGLGKVLESTIPDRLGDVIQVGAGGPSPVPPSVARLATDLLVTLGHNLTDGITGPALTVLIVGAVLFVASFFTFLVTRFIPILK